MGIDASWGGALAGALALGVMIGVAPAIPRREFGFLISCAAAILVPVGLIGNKLNGAKYPHYWWWSHCQPADLRNT